MPWQLYNLVYRSSLASRHSMQTYSFAQTCFCQYSMLFCTQTQYSESHILKIPVVKCLHTVDVPFPIILMKAKRENPMNKWFDVVAHKYVKLEQSKSGGFPGSTTVPHGRKKHSVLMSQKEMKLNHDWNRLFKWSCSQNNNGRIATWL